MLSVKTSIALCTYNGEKYLQAQLDSYALQTQLPDELIVCDDCSSDATVNIVRQFSVNAPFAVKYYVNEKNIGSTKNFEKTISLCSGEIIFLSDQDDVWKKEKIATICQVFANHQETGLVFTDASVVEDDLNSIGYCLWKSVGFNLGQQKKFSSGNAIEVLLKQNVVTGATMAFRSKFVKNFVPIPKNWVHDGWIAFFIASLSDLSFISEPLISYRQHSSNQVGGRKKSFLKKIQHSRITGADAYLEVAGQYAAMLASMEEINNDMLRADIKILVKDKVEHFQFRANLPPCFLKRVPAAWMELRKLRYQKYSGGWSSFFKDTFC